MDTTLNDYVQQNPDMPAIKFVYYSDLEPYQVVVPVPAEIVDEPGVAEQCRHIADMQWHAATGRETADRVEVERGTLATFASGSAS